MTSHANHGQSKKYHHDVVGCNSRLDNLQAGVLRIKLRKLDDYIAARRSAAILVERQRSLPQDQHVQWVNLHR